MTSKTQNARTSAIARRKVAKRLLLGASVSTAAVWFALNVWTAPIGLAWHLRNGNYAAFAGHKIRVPWDMMVHSADDDSMTIIREQPRYRILPSPSALIVISRTSGPIIDMNRDYPQIARVNEQPPKGYRFQGIHNVEAAKGKGFCWESVRADPTDYLIACRFDNDSLTAFYSGDPSHKAEFYKVVATVSEKPASP